MIDKTPTPGRGTTQFKIEDVQYTIQPHSDRWMVHRGAMPIFTLDGGPGAWRALAVDDSMELAIGESWSVVVTAATYER